MIYVPIFIRFIIQLEKKNKGVQKKRIAEKRERKKVSKKKRFQV